MKKVVPPGGPTADVFQQALLTIAAKIHLHHMIQDFTGRTDGLPSLIQRTVGAKTSKQFVVVVFGMLPLTPFASQSVDSVPNTHRFCLNVCECVVLGPGNMAPWIPFTVQDAMAGVIEI